jgi:hypothetical protein
MDMIERFITIVDPDNVVLSDLPFSPGQRVKVTIVAEDVNRDARISEIKALFKTTQWLPQAQEITEEEIAAEIAAYRALNE